MYLIDFKLAKESYIYFKTSNNWLINKNFEDLLAEKIADYKSGQLGDSADQVENCEGYYKEI